MGKVVHFHPKAPETQWPLWECPAFVLWSSAGMYPGDPSFCPAGSVLAGSTPGWGCVPPSGGGAALLASPRKSEASFRREEDAIYAPKSKCE